MRSITRLVFFNNIYNKLNKIIENQQVFMVKFRYKHKGVIQMCTHELTRSDSSTEPFYHMVKMVTVTTCITCKEKLTESKQIIGSRRKGRYTCNTA